MRALALLVVVLAVAACGGGDESATPTATDRGWSVWVGTPTALPASASGEDLEVFFEQLLGYYFKGQYGRAWERLHPAQQAVVSRSKFDECVSEGSPSADLEDVEIVDVSDEPVDVPRVPEKTLKAVTLKTTIRSGDEMATDTGRYHAIDVGGRWTWVLESQDVAAYERGECPP